MILNKITNIKWSSSNKKWFEERGYSYTKMYDKFDVKVEDLKPNSSAILKIQCDYCGKKIDRTNHTHNHLIESGSYEYTNKDACSECSKEKLVEVKHIRFKLGLLDKSDKYYYFFRENRLNIVNDYIIENKTIDNLSDCRVIIDMLNNYKENLYDMITELGYNLNEVCSQLSKFHSYLNEGHIINIFKKFYSQYEYFPSNKEIEDKLQLNSYEIFRFGGIDNIKLKLGIIDMSINYELDNKSIDLFKYNNVSGIYKITNKINGKVYIGQAVDLWKRISNGYLNTLPNGKNHNQHLQRAWDKYGGTNFKIEIQEECKKDKLNEREQYWMDYYNSCDINYGYNICPEAGSNRGHKHSAESIEKIRKHTIEHNPMKGKHHTEETKRRLSEMRKAYHEDKKFPIYQFDLEGIFIKEWESLSSVEELLGISHGNILAVIKKEKMTAGKFIWCKKEDYDNGIFELQEAIRQKKEFAHPSSRKIVQLDLQGNYIQTFDSITLASKSLNIKNCNISAVLANRQKQTTGFKFMYLEDYNEQIKQRKDLI